MITNEEMCVGLYTELVQLEDEREAILGEVRRQQLLDNRVRLLHGLLEQFSPRPWPSLEPPR